MENKPVYSNWYPARPAGATVYRPCCPEPGAQEMAAAGADAPVTAQSGRVPASCPPGFQGRYTVVAGDTMFFIAQRFGVSLDALIAANPHIPNPAVLFPGDVLCVPGAPPPPPPPPGPCRVPATCPSGFTRYTVVAGDTMFAIARRFGIPLSQLIAANPHIADPSLIFPCDVLCVPSAVACPPGFRTYVVQPGDTMFSIARRFGISLDALIAANPQIPNPSVLFPGDVVCVPGQPACPPGSQTYVVQPGDTMFFIAQRFGVSLQALIAANPQIPNPAALLPGDVLCIPPAGSSA